MTSQCQNSPHTVKLTPVTIDIRKAPITSAVDDPTRHWRSQQQVMASWRRAQRHDVRLTHAAQSPY